MQKGVSCSQKEEYKPLLYKGCLVFSGNPDFSSPLRRATIRVATDENVS